MTTPGNEPKKKEGPGKKPKSFNSQKEGRACPAKRTTEEPTENVSHSAYSLNLKDRENSESAKSEKFVGKRN